MVMYRLQNGELLNDMEFSLYDFNCNGDIIYVSYKGGWLLVDNGYLNLSTTIHPMKDTLSEKDEHWSQWLSFTFEVLTRTMSNSCFDKMNQVMTCTKSLQIAKKKLAMHHLAEGAKAPDRDARINSDSVSKRHYWCLPK
eukprot:jgi/Psemu1/6931/gm1.6931_g